jgi:cyclohexanone monooxygenase
VPHLGKHAKQLYVFQRTPSSVDVRGNKPTDPEWAKALAPGWQKRRMDNFNVLVAGGFQDEDLVSDGWTDIIRNLGARRVRSPSEGSSPEELAKTLELADFKKMNQVRARVDSVVQDKATAEALKPWYRQFCKRPTFNDDYLPTFNRPNVKLIDTKGSGVDRVTEKGLVVDGVEYEVDCIIFATGFEVGTAYTRRAGYEIYGRGSQTLTDYWANGTRTLHGFYSHGFPNCFHLGILQNALTPNFPHMLDEQVRHIAEVIQHAEQRQARVIEPTAEAEAEWVQTIRDTPNAGEKFYMQCTPGYYNGEGKEGHGGLFSGLYGAGPVAFYDLVRDWRSTGMKGLQFA